MSLEGLVKEIEDARKMEQARWMATIREQYESTIRAKDEEIATLRDEIETLRRWLDHSALPAANPISKRPEALGLIKLNFGKDKPPPEMWRPGEKEILDSVERKIPEEITDEEPEEAETPHILDAKLPEEIPETSLPEPPKPDRIHLPETEPPEPGEIILHEQEQPESPKPEPHETRKTETPKPVRAARRISRLRGPAKKKARRRSRPGKKAR